MDNPNQPARSVEFSPQPENPPRTHLLSRALQEHKLWLHNISTIPRWMLGKVAGCAGKEIWQAWLRWKDFTMERTAHCEGLKKAPENATVAV